VSQCQIHRTEAGWNDARDHLQFATHLTAYVHHVSFQGYRPLKLWLSCKILEKGVSVPPICSGMGYLGFQTCIFKLDWLLSMWPVLVEFRSASANSSWWKKKKESVVKHKSADMYVGQPNNIANSNWPTQTDRVEWLKHISLDMQALRSTEECML